MKPIRVLVVEDSSTVRSHLVEVLNGDPQITVVGEATDGREAIEMCRTLRPDVVTLDMMLPVMTGAVVTEYIMAYFPTPILVVSSSTNRGELYKTYDALAAGALSVLDKPSIDDDSDEWAKELVAQVRLVSRIKVITHPRGKLSPSGTYMAQWDEPTEAAAKAKTKLVVIGTSTGGPAAIESILHKLPAKYPIPILLVIHLSKNFGGAFSEWLNGLSLLPVRDAIDGEPLPRFGTPGVIMAPPDFHLVVRSGKLRLTLEPPLLSCRPSVDMLFQSVAKEVGNDAAGLLLTGMGKDGAEGLLALRRSGAQTVAQDEASSVIFGMPREAIVMGAAQRVLSLDEIADYLLSLAKSE